MDSIGGAKPEELSTSQVAISGPIDNELSEASAGPVPAAATAGVAAAAVIAALSAPETEIAKLGKHNSDGYAPPPGVRFQAHAYYGLKVGRAQQEMLADSYTSPTRRYLRLRLSRRKRQMRRCQQ